MSNVILKLHIEKPGADYIHKDQSVNRSAAGHVWMEINYPDGTSSQGGFAPADPKGGIYSAPGEVQHNDKNAYVGESHFTATYKITGQQALILEKYFVLPEAFGFDKSHYHAMTNSCVDFVWKGLEQIGMNSQKFEGYMYPMENIYSFSHMKNPQIPGGGLVGIEEGGITRPLNDYIDPHFNEMWSLPSYPWIHTNSLPDLNMFLTPQREGTIEVGPLSPPTPFQQDGSNYADGTAYQ